MARVTRILGRIVLGFVALVLVLLAAVYALSARALGKTYPIPDVALTIPADSASIARGEHLFQAVLGCAGCHGQDAGGRVFAEMGPVGTGAGANLTRGAGGVGTSYADADYVRAIRHGIRRDGTSLLMMPSEVYTNLSDDDLGAVITYLKQLPPVDRDTAKTRLKPLGRALLAFGKLPMLSAPKTHHAGTTQAVPADSTAVYGRYLVSVSGCTGCHGSDLTGGEAFGPPGTPPPPNLTPARLGTWTDEDFLTAIRKGRRPDGSAINELMPWREYSGMTDVELQAIWLYLRSVPPAERRPASEGGA
jgi:mono/diheme cytochrome c family protein